MIAAAKEADFAQILAEAPQGGKACNPSSGYIMACMFQNTITVGSTNLFFVLIFWLFDFSFLELPSFYLDQWWRV